MLTVFLAPVQEERRKAVLRDRKRLCIGLDEAKRTSEKVQASLRKEKEALEAERARRADVERKLLPDKRHQLETARREVEEARDVEARLEKEMADGRNKLADIRQSLVDQQWQLAQARGRLDQGGRQRENTQMQKLLQVAIEYSVLLSLVLHLSYCNTAV